jgi:hypothetical protein
VRLFPFPGYCFFLHEAEAEASVELGEPFSRST